MDGLDKDLVQPFAGYWGIAILPETATIEKIAGDVVQLPQMQNSLPQTADQVATNTTTTDTITAIGKAANEVIQAIKGNQQTATADTNNVANDTPTPTTDKGKKTATILWIVGGVVVVGTLLYLALKPHN